MIKPERFKPGDIATIKRVIEFMEYSDWAEKEIGYLKQAFKYQIQKDLSKRSAQPNWYICEKPTEDYKYHMGRPCSCNLIYEYHLNVKEESPK